MSELRTFDPEFAGDGLPPRGDVLLAISNAIVRLYKECYGKGPTKAKTYHHGDVITCVLRGGLTRAEQVLVAAGHEEGVHSHRRMLHIAVRDRFIGAVEELAGRRVIGYMNGTQVDPEMTAEVFVLAPMESPNGDSPGPAGT